VKGSPEPSVNGRIEADCLRLPPVPAETRGRHGT